MMMNLQRAYCIVAFVLFVTTAVAQSRTHYVVVGAYAVKRNADQALRHTRDMGFEPTYQYVVCRQLYYVYIFAAPDRAAGLQYMELNSVRVTFPDSWLFHGTFDCQDTATEVMEAIAAPEEILPATIKSSVEEEHEPPALISKPGTVFKLYDQLARLVDGKVSVVDASSQKLQGTFNANTQIPFEITREVELTSKVIGYRTLVASYVPPETDQSIREVSLHLQPLKKGEFIELTSIRFQPKSVLLAAESKEDLMQLASFLAKNPSIEIKLHGHTNDKRGLNATMLGKSTNLFEPDKKNARQHVSAKAFSKARAETVKSFLVSRGIASSRITTAGFGATRRIFAKTDPEAELNDRVEAELVTE